MLKTANEKDGQMTWKDFLAKRMVANKESIDDIVYSDISIDLLSNTLLEVDFDNFIVRSKRCVYIWRNSSVLNDFVVIPLDASEVEVKIEDTVEDEKAEDSEAESHSDIYPNGNFVWTGGAYISTDTKQSEDFALQRLEQGFSDDETWDLMLGVCIFLAPRLKRFKEISMGYPDEYSIEEWDEMLDEFIWYCEQYIDGFAYKVEDEEEAAYFHAVGKKLCDNLFNFWW